jgi:hypothetical protein
VYCFIYQSSETGDQEENYFFYLIESQSSLAIVNLLFLLGLFFDICSLSIIIFFMGFFVYSPPLVHVYIWAPDSWIQVLFITWYRAKIKVFFSLQCTVWLTLWSPLVWSILSLIFIVARLCFDRRLFFVTTPRRDSAAAVAVSETRRRRLPICYSRPTVDWIGINSVAVGRRPLCSVPLWLDRCCLTPARLG